MHIFYIYTTNSLVCEYKNKVAKKLKKPEANKISTYRGTYVLFTSNKLNL